MTDKKGKCNGKGKGNCKIQRQPLLGYFDIHENTIEIGVDEAGRGPLFGRVYCAAVILPKNETMFDFTKVKDSKKFTSKKKIEEVAQYIKEHALAWHVSFSDEKTIDKINILQATQYAMHEAIREVRKSYNNKYINTINNTINNNKIEGMDYQFHLLIDGNYFNPLTVVNTHKNQIELLKHTTIPSGDNTYASIASASILAKVERDNYIDEMCIQYPLLSSYYGIDSNKGYGAKKHMDGIQEHGITVWHRQSFAPCKNATQNVDIVNNINNI